MAVREFTDTGGREWRVWDVMPESIHPQTKTEDYLADMYRTGWLVFETKAEDEKRRLADIPRGWSELSGRGLETLLERAEVIPPRKLRALRQARGEEAARQQEHAIRRARELADLPPAERAAGPEEEEERPDITDLGVVRTFRYPGGRYWTVCVIRRPDEGGPPVLRFTSGARDIDLGDWPKDWADYRDEGLVELLRFAAPRPPGRAPGPDTPRRRYNDPPLGG
ncbi:MAG: hypothetical protein M3282_08980 [Gemmatimonadota bacterium]|nr:hypothetical protein [Gemmatimonadota bacterium]